MLFRLGCSLGQSCTIVRRSSCSLDHVDTGYSSLV